jgi:hypothetical protein
MSSVNEYAGAGAATSAPALDLHEIQATVLRQRPAPYFGAHVLLRIDNSQAGRAFSEANTLHRFRCPVVDGGESVACGGH